MPIEKSSIFATYAAQGICTIVFHTYMGESIYEKNIDYVLMDDLNKNNFSEIAMNANRKYLLKAKLTKHVNSFLKAFSL